MTGNIIRDAFASTFADPLVTIVLLVYKDKQVVNYGLNVLDNTNYPNIEIVIVDNYGNDGSMDIISSWMSKSKRNVRIIAGSHDHCITSALNKALSVSNGKYVLYLNADTIVTSSDWLSRLVAVMECNNGAGVAVPTVLNPDLVTVQTTGIISHFHTYCKNRFTGAMYAEVKKLPTIEVDDMPIGSVFLWRRAMGIKIGSFDEMICPVSFSETDFFWRMKKSGAKLFWVPSSSIAHLGGHSFGRSSEKTENRMFEGFKNAIRSVLKNAELGSMPLELILLVFPDMYVSVTKTLRAFLKAVVWNLSILDDTLEKRQESCSLEGIHHQD